MKKTTLICGVLLCAAPVLKAGLYVGLNGGATLASGNRTDALTADNTQANDALGYRINVDTGFSQWGKSFGGTLGYGYTFESRSLLAFGDFYGGYQKAKHTAKVMDIADAVAADSTLTIGSNMGASMGVGWIFDDWTPFIRGGIERAPFKVDFTQYQNDPADPPTSPHTAKKWRTGFMGSVGLMKTFGSDKNWGLTFEWRGTYYTSFKNTWETDVEDTSGGPGYAKASVHANVVTPLVHNFALGAVWRLQ